MATKLFWQAVDHGELLPNLRLRDLDRRCIAFKNTIDDLVSLGEFAATIFHTPQIYSSWKKHLFALSTMHGNMDGKTQYLATSSYITAPV